MALQQFGLIPNGTFFKNKMFPSKPISSPSTFVCSCVPHAIQCKASTVIVPDPKNTARRTTNYYPPSIWPYDYIQSLRSDFLEESYRNECDRLKEEVRMTLSELKNPVDQLEFIDVLQRLGVAYHFSLEIGSMIKRIYMNDDALGRNKNLYAKALEFRLLRQHGFDVSSDVFNGFLDNKGKFHSSLSDDIKGMLSLYEASFHSMKGEMILDEAREFSSTHLKEFLHKCNEDNDISLLVNHALELPLRWRIQRLEARWFIDVYGRRQNMNPALLKLAKVDFNIVQANYQEDLKQASRWWKRLGLGEKLNYARDRMVENFIWTVAFAFEPHSGYYRRVGAMVNALITTIDDTYDVYGKLEELELFTEVIDRWDINAIDVLPDYMKICFFALYNFVNEVAFDLLKENGHNVTPHLKKAWADLCKSYLVEARWYYNNYQPSLQEYLKNAWISIGAPVILVHAFFALSDSSIQDLVSLGEYSDIIRSSATILRLANDLGTAKREKETGDVSKSMECFMNETGASEADARRHVNYLIWETWKKMNKEAINSSNFESFTQVALNIGTMSLFMYEHGDAHSIQDLETKNCITSLLFQPIM